MADFLGSVFELGASYRAHFQHRDEGRKQHVYGPRRGQKRRAEEDLELMRTAARGKTEKRDVYAAIAEEGRRLKERAEWEGAVVVAAHHASQDLFSESEDDAQEYHDEYYNDCDEEWQDIGEDGRLPNWKPPPPLEVPDPSSAIEATALLSKFRPARGTPEQLKKLLAARADPNIVAGECIHPLNNVYTFACREHVGVMRAMLLEAGAVESDAMRERWDLWRRADANEDAWLRNFHQDPRP